MAPSPGNRRHRRPACGGNRLPPWPDVLADPDHLGLTRCSARLGRPIAHVTLLTATRPAAGGAEISLGSLRSISVMLASEFPGLPLTGPRSPAEPLACRRLRPRAPCRIQEISHAAR